MNNRDRIMMILIGLFLTKKWSDRCHRQASEQQIFKWAPIEDESDVLFREVNNKTDDVVIKRIAAAYKQRILQNRAALEREQMLDAYNYLNNKNHQA